MTRPTCITVLASLVALSAAANAAPADEAQPHIKAASSAYNEGNYDKALAELDAAYAIDPQPDLLYALGQAYAKLGRCPEATTSFERFKQASSDPAVAGVVEQAVAACKPRAAIEATTTTTTTAATTEVPPAGGSDSPAAGSADTTAAGSASTLEHETAELPQPLPARPHAGPWYTDKLGDGLVAGGVVASVAGIVLYHGATADLDQAEASSSLAAYNQLVDNARSERTLSIVMIAGGSALVVAGIVRYVLRDGGTDRAETPGIGMAAVPGGGFVTLRGAF